jgi:hypothetical protein
VLPRFLYVVVQREREARDAPRLRLRARRELGQQGRPVEGGLGALGDVHGGTPYRAPSTAEVRSHQFCLMIRTISDHWGEHAPLV